MRARKILEQRTDVIAQFAIADSGVTQDVSRQHIEVELGRDAQLAIIAKNGLHQARGIKNGIAGLGIGQKIDEGDGFGLRACQSAHDKIKIRSGKPRPTIRLNHRKPIISTGGARRQDASPRNGLSCSVTGVLGSKVRAYALNGMEAKYLRLC